MRGHVGDVGGGCSDCLMSGAPSLPVEVVDASLDALVGIDRALASLTALRMAVVDGLLEPLRSSDLATRSMHAEIAVATRSPESTVAAFAAEACLLIRDMPATFRRLSTGDLTVRHARILADEAIGLTDEDRAAWEARALLEAHRSTGDFTRTVRRLRERRAPEAAAERHHAARQHANVWMDPHRDGMAYLTAYLPVPEACAIRDHLDDLARLVVAAEPDTPIGQARVDVLSSLLLERRPGGDRLGAVKTTAVITMPVETLLGGSAQGELEGAGLVDAETARALAAGATVFRRLLTDPHTGVRLELGREQYRPTADQRLWLRLRDRRCRWPGCRRPVAASDLDHTVDWQFGGATDASNLAHLCRRHHTLKHQTGWRVRSDPAGTMWFTSPADRRYESPIPTDPDPPWVADLPLRDPAGHDVGAR